MAIHATSFGASCNRSLAFRFPLPKKSILCIEHNMENYDFHIQMVDLICSKEGP